MPTSTLTAENDGVSSEKGTIPAEDEIQQTLQLILKSPSFQDSERCKQFLTYVVENTIRGKTEFLKERIIGIEVFGRAADYATGDDPIVRVQAREVRRRLRQYYEKAASPGPRVRIDLPTGSYLPTFCLLSEPSPQADVVDADNNVGQPSLKARYYQVAIFAALILAVLSGVAAVHIWPKQHTPTMEERFWAPALGSREPILICIPQPVVYLPDYRLYQSYSSANPQVFRSVYDRMSKVIPFKADEKLKWGDFHPAEDLGLGVGDVYAAQLLMGYLAANHGRVQTKIGADYTFDDLRNSPSILIGAFSNPWSIMLLSKLRFAFTQDYPGGVSEQIPSGRQWHEAYDANGHLVRDYAIVARLLNSETGQFTVVIAGSWAAGARAAAELVTTPDSLAQLLQAAPSGWEKKNIEIVLEADVTSRVSSPPHVVATYSW